MLSELDITPFAVNGTRPISLASHHTDVEKIYRDKSHYRSLLKEYRKEIDTLQNKMYAHDRYGLLAIFQAMDAAGKDSTIREVMSGINPHGVEVHAFKKPSDEELDHSFLWRSNLHMPKRGKIHLFNRSYYEEVLVTKVHPEIITQFQRIPKEKIVDIEQLWQQRFSAIKNLEAYEFDNGIHTLKFFLNVSKEEQKRRFIKRLDNPEKNWKFSKKDIEERNYWEAYMHAYEEAINATATVDAPWYIVPADDKKNMRLIVAKIILEHLESLDMHFPSLSSEDLSKLSDYRAQLENN